MKILFLLIVWPVAISHQRDERIDTQIPWLDAMMGIFALLLRVCNEQRVVAGCGFGATGRLGCASVKLRRRRCRLGLALALLRRLRRKKCCALRCGWHCEPRCDMCYRLIHLRNGSAGGGGGHWLIR